MEMIQKFVISPCCKNEVKLRGDTVICVKCGRKFAVINGLLVDTLNEQPDYDNKQREVWDRHYLDKEYIARAEKTFMDVYHDYVISQLNELEDMYDGSGKVFCEIGCGTGYLADSLIENGWFFIGVDFSMDQLRFLEERLRAKQLGNYLLIRADIRNVPIRSGVVDLVCGLGVIEHVKSSETLTVLQNLYRILKNGGNSFNSVPVFNPGNLIYRSQWGGIPNIPIFKQLAEFVHIKILKEKHMRFGYELQFTPSQMRKLHIEAGFDRESIKIGRFRHKIILRAIRNGKIRDYLVKLCETNRLFWPMIKISATKTKP